MRGLHNKSNDEPSIGEALQSAEREKLIEAIREKIKKLTARGVFCFIKKEQLPQGKRLFRYIPY